MTLIDFKKEELSLLLVALNEYQRNPENFYLDEMSQVTTKINNMHKMCTCKENVSNDT